MSSKTPRKFDGSTGSSTPPANRVSNRQRSGVPICCEPVSNPVRTVSNRSRLLVSNCCLGVLISTPNSSTWRFGTAGTHAPHELAEHTTSDATMIGETCAARCEAGGGVRNARGTPHPPKGIFAQRLWRPASVGGQNFFARRLALGGVNRRASVTGWPNRRAFPAPCGDPRAILLRWPRERHRAA
jgi:hypothetical protein